MSLTTQVPQPIIDLILADINAVIPNFTSLVSSYRLLVGAAEEIRRTADVCPDVFERAVRRFDNAGLLIDILLELLCCKIVFSSEFLQISCAPVDLFRILNNRTTATDTPIRTAEQVVEMELLVLLLANCLNQESCLPCNKVICPENIPVKKTVPIATIPPAAPPSPEPVSSDILEVEAAALEKLLTETREPPSKVRVPHLKSFFKKHKK